LLARQTEVEVALDGRQGHEDDGRVDERERRADDRRREREFLARRSSHRTSG
jgi:hypothetical protein